MTWNGVAFGSPFGPQASQPPYDFYQLLSRNGSTTLQTPTTPFDGNNTWSAGDISSAGWLTGSECQFRISSTNIRLDFQFSGDESNVLTDWNALSASDQVLLIETQDRGVFEYDLSGWTAVAASGDVRLGPGSYTYGTGTLNYDAVMEDSIGLDGGSNVGLTWANTLGITGTTQIIHVQLGRNAF